MKRVSTKSRANALTKSKFRCQPNLDGKLKSSEKLVVCGCGRHFRVQRKYPKKKCPVCRDDPNKSWTLISDRELERIKRLEPECTTRKMTPEERMKFGLTRQFQKDQERKQLDKKADKARPNIKLPPVWEPPN